MMVQKEKGRTLLSLVIESQTFSNVYVQKQRLLVLPHKNLETELKGKPANGLTSL